jgi:hypothetical protein
MLYDILSERASGMERMMIGCHHHTDLPQLPFTQKPSIWLAVYCFYMHAIQHDVEISLTVRDGFVLLFHRRMFVRSQQCYSRLFGAEYNRTMGVGLYSYFLFPPSFLHQDLILYLFTTKRYLHTRSFQTINN